MATEGHDQPHNSQKLNLIFHGTFVFVEDQKQGEIRALIPDIGHHSRRAGNWLGETELAPGSYVLGGTDPNGYGVTFDEKLNLILNFEKLTIAQEPYATLILPLPRKITSLRVAEIPRNLFEPPDLALKLGLKEKEHMATLQVLTYSFKTDDQLLLKFQGKDGGHYWEPVFTGDCINLHIFSAEDHHQGPSLSTEDFDACVALLGTPLRLRSALSPGGIDEDVTLPAGLRAEETEDLAPRTARMARVGRLLKQNGDLNQAWYKNDALDKDPPACGPLIARKGVI